MTIPKHISYLTRVSFYHIKWLQPTLGLGRHVSDLRVSAGESVSAAEEYPLLNRN